MITDVTSQEQLEEIVGREPRVVVKFTAPAWCVPCQRLAPHYKKVAESKTDVTFLAVDIDNNEWAMVEYGVQSVPTLMLFEDGKYVKHLQERNGPKLLGEIA